MANHKYIHISKGPTILHGESAKEAIGRENDSEFYVSGQGIPRVSRSRWEAAQEAEGSHWFGDGSKPPRNGDDRNIIHYNRFDSYRVISQSRFERALEIGSGPFTNMRLVASEVSYIAEATLLDPALNDYLSHPGCFFNQYAIAKVRPTKFYTLVWPFLPRKLKDLWFYSPKRSVRIGGLISREAEGFDGGQQFDLVLMVNVLEHCMDSSRVLDAVFAALAPGGIVILSDKTHTDEAVRLGLSRIYDVAHPIRVTKSAIEERLNGFEILFHSSFEDPVSLYLPGTEESYWIAKKPS